MKRLNSTVTSRIIEPITSRCTKFRFKPLDDRNSLARLQYICDKEKVNTDDGVRARIPFSRYFQSLT